MRSALALAAVTTGCFSPRPPLGDPCGPNDWCPPPLQCIASVCVGSGTTDAPAGSAPLVSASPGPAPLLASSFAWCNAYGAAVPVVVAADDPAATIYYTTDGTTPSESSPSGTTPVALAAKTTSFSLAYFAKSPAGAASAIATDAFALDPTSTCRSTWGFLVTDTKLDGRSPVVDATPGQTLHATATVQVWTTSGCVGCMIQLVYGIDPSYEGCVFDASGVTFPGTTQSASFTLTAPTTPGVYDVLVRLVFDNNCTMARADVASPTWEPRKVRIGVVVVH